MKSNSKNTIQQRLTIVASVANNLLSQSFIIFYQRIMGFNKIKAKHAQVLVSKCLVFLALLGFFATDSICQELSGLKVNYQVHSVAGSMTFNGNDGSEEPTWITAACPDTEGDKNEIIPQYDGTSGKLSTCNTTIACNYPRNNGNDLECGSGCELGWDSKLLTRTNIESSTVDIHFRSWEDDGGERCEGGSHDGRQSWIDIFDVKDFPASSWTNKKINYSAGFATTTFKSTWRYTRGRKSGQTNGPIDFGAVSSYVWHDNSNRSKPSGADANMGYINDWNNNHQPSPDVTYKFEIKDEARRVVISTFVSPNFDSYLYIYDEDGTKRLFEDDNGGAQLLGGEPGSSLIDEEFCPGIYTIVVEGKGNATGNFRLNIEPTGINFSAGAIKTSLSEACEGTKISDIINMTPATTIAGKDVDYQWQRRVGAGTFIDINGETEENLINPGLMGTENISFQRKASLCGYEEISNIVTINYSTLLPDEPKQFAVTPNDPSQRIELSFTRIPEATKYLITRTAPDGSELLIEGKFDEPDSVVGNILYFYDESLEPCVTYKYTVVSENDCGVSLSSTPELTARVEDDIAQAFENGSDFTASKGFYSDRVELNWSVNNNAKNTISTYVIERKVVGQPDSLFREKESTEGNIWSDETADPSVFYEYRLFGTSKCDNQSIYTDTITEIGFRSKIAQVNGNVAYTGPITIKGAAILARPTSGTLPSYSAQVAGELKIAAPNIEIDQNLIIESWVNFDQLAFLGLWDTGEFLAVKAGEITFAYNNESIDVLFDANNSPLASNTWAHVAGQMTADSMFIYLNGNVVSRTKRQNTDSYVEPNKEFTPISSVLSKITEFRVWNIEKSHEQIKNDHSRYMSGFEDGLEVFLPTNEGAGSALYDRSRENENKFNRNHAIISTVGTMLWSEEVPSESELGHKAITDEEGNYIINLPYGSSGSNYLLVPDYRGHSFDPTNRILFVGDGASVINGIDFTDISSFEIKGQVFYEGTQCPVPGAFIKVDGEILTSAGEAITTDDDGEFTVQVPIGEHVLKITTTGMDVPDIRIPLEGTKDFQENENLGAFFDPTTVRVTGRVVGGDREANKKIGFDKSAANIGQATVTFSNASCDFTKNVTTNAISGEYVIDVPPIVLIPSVTTSDATVNQYFLDDPKQPIDFAEELVTMTVTDTIFQADEVTVQEVDSISFNTRIDFIYRTTPQIQVFDRDGLSPFIGDKELVIRSIDANGDIVKTTRNLKDDPLMWPVFSEQTDDYLYRCLIRVFELYGQDTVPTVFGELKIDNKLSDLSEFAGIDTVDVEAIHTIKMSQINTPDSVKTLIYSFKTSSPNMSTGTFTPHDYTKSFTITLNRPGKDAIEWTPVTDNSLISPGSKGYYRGYILGSVVKSSRFETEGIEVPDFVLRDPPGSNSSASLTQGSTSTKQASYSWNAGSEASTTDRIKVGARFGSGIGVSITTDVKNEITNKFTAAISGGRGGTQQLQTTQTQKVSTSSIPKRVGAASDVYFGRSRNLEFALSEELVVVDESMCIKVPCEDSGPLPGKRFSKLDGISFAPDGYATSFTYTQHQIINEIIPQATANRNALLANVDLYRSIFNIGDEFYGANNDDPDLPGRNENDPNNADEEDLIGASYEYLPFVNNVESGAEALANDKIRFFNEQIEIWEETIRQNEEEKARIDDKKYIDSLERIQLLFLKAKYQDTIDSYVGLSTGVAAAAIPAAFVLVSAPIPGTSITGYAVFGVTSGLAIAQNELVGAYEEYEVQRQRIEDKFDRVRQIEVPNNTFDGGVGPITQSVSISTAETTTRSLEYKLGAQFGAEIVGEVNGTGTSFVKSFALEVKSGFNWKNSTSENEKVEFTFSDNDVNDRYSIDIYQSPLGWGPIFKVKPGGQTACPHEPAEISKYYRDENGEPVELSAATARVDMPSIELAAGASPLLQNIPADGVASFELQVSNQSDVELNRTFIIETLAKSNPFGANVNIDFFPSAEIRIPTKSKLTKIVTIEKGPGTVYEYNDLQIVMYAPCDKLVIRDTVTVSVHFIPECTKPELFTPSDQWVVNTNSLDTGKAMPIVIGDYDFNDPLLQQFTLMYKPIEESRFIPFKTFWKDPMDAPNPANALIIPGDDLTTSYDWTHGLNDGFYDLMVESVCVDTLGNELATSASEIHSGYIDTERPQAFGSPSPADGILDPDDDILLRLNEPINAGIVTNLNFDIRGVLNQTTIDGHHTSLSLDGIDDHGIITDYQLQKRSMSIEFWLKKTRSGEEVILSQGLSDSDQLLISTTSSDNLKFQLGSTSITSGKTLTLDQWWHCAITYNEVDRKAQIFMVNVNEPAGAQSLTVTGKMTTDYTTSGPIYIAKHSAGSLSPFKGFIHDLRLWSIPLTILDIPPRRNQTLSGREAGLIGYWPLNEGYGSIGFDKVRGRHANVTAASWNILPQNHAFMFDGTDDYLVADSVSTLAYTAEADMTMEAWFKTGAGIEQTIFSNGKGDGSLNPDSWKLSLDAAGQVYIQNNGETIITNRATSLADNDWHHIAVVVKRTQAVSLYIDGELLVTGNASVFGGFGGNKLWIGSRGWIESNGTEGRDQYFNGSLDDIRIWNTARTPEQIQRDFTYQMEGDELGLQVYYPFDIVEVDAQNQINRVESIVDVSTAISYDLALGGATPENYVIAAPPIKIPRFTQRANFDYIISGDEIFIEITNSPARVENVTIDITVEGLKDLAGNTMESPETWIAYINKNQVFWAEEYFSFEKNAEDELSFTATLQNSGGSQENYSIANLPNWLSASTISGSIGPNSSIPVTFTVAPLMNIGEYEQDIYVSTESFGFNERFLLDLKVYEDPPEWTVDPNAYDFSMSIVGQAFVNDIISIDEDDIVSVWIDNEVRGVSSVEFDPASGKYLVFLSVFSNANIARTGKLSFKLWDASAGRILEADPYMNGILQTYLFTDGDLIGSLGNPLAIKAEALIELEYDLKSGWNWLSFPLESERLESLDSMFFEFPLLTGDFIRDDSLIAHYGDDWETGSLKSLNTDYGYKMKVANEGSFSYSGSFIDPSQDPIAIDSNWNWIGLKSLFIIDIESALANLELKTGDLIKSQSGFAIYDEDFGWGGNLEFLQPQEGYMFKFNKKAELVYPGFGNINARSANTNNLDQNVAKRKLNAKNAVASRQSERTAYIEGSYSSNMSLIASLDDCIEVDNPDEWLLAAYASGESRGVTHKSSDGRYYLSIEGESTTPLDFKLLHKSENIEILLNETFDFVTDGIEGSLRSPYVFSCSPIIEVDCPDNMMIQSSHIMNNLQSVLRANSYIQSPATIPNGANVTFKAGVEVELLRNFETIEGATFQVVIEGCDND